MSTGTIATVLIVTFFSSMSLAAIPSACLVGVLLVLSTLEIPADAIGIILAVERILDMCRTVVNVFGTSCCAVLIAKSEGEQEVLKTVPEMA